MGTYTEHWRQHRRRSIRGLVYVLLWLVLGLGAIALTCFAVQQRTGEYPAYLNAGLFGVWLVVFTRMSLRYSKVSCPRCQHRFSHGKWVTRCPGCGLGIGQEEA